MGSESEDKVLDKITLNFSPTSEVIWSSGKKLMKSVTDSSECVTSIHAFNDISELMRKRAIHDYGIDPSFVVEDEKLVKLWRWIRFVCNLDEHFFRGVRLSKKLIGVRDLIDCDKTAIKMSDVEYLPMRRTQNENGSMFSLYKSDERNRALILCEWKHELDGDIENLVKSLQAERKYTRAAAINIFNFRLENAIECLTKGSSYGGGDPTLSAVAMALSGYTGERNTLWCEMCKNLRNKFSDPYLKAIFCFLTSDSSNYDEILQDDGLNLSDRIAFACKFLPDAKLYKYLQSLTQKLVDSGDLEGLLLLGLSNAGIDLIQRYIESTSDVQTISLVILHSLPAKPENQRVNVWVEKYRELLDCWCLWHKRALFDIEWYKKLPSKLSPPQQLFASCNFCQQSVSSNYRLIGSSRSGQRSTYEQQQFGRVSVSAATNKTRIQSCPSCRKPLPRCALCLTQLGTPAGVYWRGRKSDDENETIERKLSPFPSWFTFCQTCRHGGHSKHMIDWFREHIECPVSGCNCKCMSLDSKTCDITNS
ncbi:WD repeat-containing protein mio-like protein [Dinothrombium tinctorium]|uniref:WD repeat-containing protein mio-like protein n=1 Tax=Dinothrombium tinctorium TaxID=1965070 RepID=A0A443RP23_9ACAR|nr:WD repeat-containing protein mio-like protein [Dinothrombium tinctorium]